MSSGVESNSVFGVVLTGSGSIFTPNPEFERPSVARFRRDFADQSDFNENITNVRGVRIYYGPLDVCRGDEGRSISRRHGKS